MYELMAIGFAFCVFIFETIVLAGNDWKVSRKTPVYNYTYKRHYSFCNSFWSTLVFYVYGTVIAFVASGALIGWCSFLFDFGTTPTIATGLGMFLTTIAFFIACIFLVVFAFGIVVILPIVKLIEKSEQSNNQFTKGVSNWYSQIKDKYCPIITKENE